MSMAAVFSGPDKGRWKSCHRRIDSGEIDVFEAERYFSAINENLGHGGSSLSQKIGLNIREDYGSTRQGWRQGRVSLDVPMMRHNHHLHHTLSQPQDMFLDNIKPSKEKKKHKQPSSPGGKLASFFNSLISQTVSKKKKSSKSSTQSVKEIVEEESPGGWRRRRRSSISHFRSSASSTTTSTTTTTRTTKTAFSDIDAKSIHSCPSVPGFQTPPRYLINTPIKPYKEFRSYPDPKQVLVALSKYSNSAAKPNSAGTATLDWLDDKFKPVNGSSEKQSSKDLQRYRGSSEKRSWGGQNSSQESREFKRFAEEDGAESDSSSDLFELQLNYDHHQLGCCASGLPVYESTHMDSIKISTGTPITNGPFRNC